MFQGSAVERLAFIITIGNLPPDAYGRHSAIYNNPCEEVAVNASAAGGEGGYTYAVFYKRASDTKWTTKQDFAENATVSIKPTKAVNYDVCVKVKDTSGTIVKKYFTLTSN